MSNTKPGFKLTPRKLLLIALLIVALLVIALVGFTYSMLTSKPAVPQQVGDNRQAGGAAQVEMLTPGGGTAVIGAASQFNAAQITEAEQSSAESQPASGTGDGYGPDRQNDPEPAESPSADPRENRPQPPKRNPDPPAAAVQETPLEPIRRSSREPEPEPSRSDGEPQPLPEPQPVRSEPAPRQQQPATPPRQREVMDNLF